MNRFFPFHHLGLRCNPFRALTDEEWVEVAVLPERVEELLASEAGAHVQLLGDQGRGKSTALRSLAARLADRGRRVRYEYLGEGRNRFETDAKELDVFLLDEAQRLNGGERRRLLSLAGRTPLRLIISSHEDMAVVFQRMGLSVQTLTVEVGDEEHFRRIIERRLAYFALDPHRPPDLAEELVSRVWAEFGSDLRSAERFLYEALQEKVGERL